MSRNLIQDLYLKEVKAFKPTPASAKDAESSVRAWAAPKAPAAPSIEGTNTAELSEYESAAVEVEMNKPSTEGEQAPSASMEEWFVVEDQFAEGEAHH